MQPTLQPRDWVIADQRLSARSDPRPGQILLLRDPEDDSRVLVKRVSHVDPHGNVWVLGDNSSASRDSRAFGAVPPERVLARVRWRYWPFPFTHL